MNSQDSLEKDIDSVLAHLSRLECIGKVHVRRSKDENETFHWCEYGKNSWICYDFEEWLVITTIFQ